MNNQSNNFNIYSSNFSGYVSLNRDILDKIGLGCDKNIKLRAIYIFLVERTNWQTGIVYFSYRFANDVWDMGYPKYKKILKELVDLGLAKVLDTKKGETTKLMLVHYKQVIQGNKKELDKGTEPIVLNQKNETQSVSTLPDSEPATFNPTTSVWEAEETQPIIEHIAEPKIEVVVEQPKAYEATFPSLIKTPQTVKFNEDESAELFYSYLKLRTSFTEIALIDKIRLTIVSTKETFNQHCNRMIQAYTPSLEDQLSSKL